MPTCPKCRVELAEGTRACPLCGFSLEVGPPGSAPEHYLDPSGSEGLTDEERTTIAWEVLSVSTLIGAVVVSAVNLIVDRTLSWALYPLAALALVWVLFTALFKLGKRPLQAVLLSGAALPAFLLGLDLIDGGLGWAPAVAVPIALVVELSAGAAAFASLRAKRKGPNVFAFCLVAVSASCAGIDATVGLYSFGRLSFGWSAIVASALVPVAAFLLYLHHRVTKKANLRKLFRL
jgi:hypothetical protein